MPERVEQHSDIEEPSGLRKRRTRLACFLVAGALLRLLLIWFPRTFDDDTNTYTELGTNLLRHGIYGIRQGDVIVPSLIRLPGYPVFLGLMGGDLHVTLLVQGMIDMIGCWLLCLFATRHISERAGEIVLALSTLCIFTAAYAATGLAESLSIFAVTLGIFFFGELQRNDEAGEPGWSALLRKSLPMAVAAALAILLRPDGVLLYCALLIGLLWYGRGRRMVTITLLFSVLALLPLVPWTARNWTVFHVVQPLAPEYANNPGERVNQGFVRWFRTWAVEFSSTGNIYWNLNSDVFDIEDLPPRAFDSATQYAETSRLFDAYNQDATMTPVLDAEFGQLANQRIAAHPVRFYLWLPMFRLADMWLRPRTETFNLDVFWWWWRIHPWQSAAGLALGLLNLAYLVAALWGAVLRRAPYMVLMVSYVAMRCILLAAVANPEPRYTLEAYPIVIVLAGAFLAGLGNRKSAALSLGARRGGLAAR